MRPTTTPPITRSIAIAAALLAVALLAAPVAAKEFVEARLDAPIPMGTPGGTEILVGIQVSVSEPDGIHPVEGTPMYLRLFGRDGSTTRAAAAADKTPGHYTFRIAIPAGGARDLEIGIHGTSDLPGDAGRRRPVHVRRDHGPDRAAGAAAGPGADAGRAGRGPGRTRGDTGDAARRRAGDAGRDPGGRRPRGARGRARGRGGAHGAGPAATGRA